MRPEGLQKTRGKSRGTEYREDDKGSAPVGFLKAVFIVEADRVEEEQKVVAIV